MKGIVLAKVVTMGVVGSRGRHGILPSGRCNDGGNRTVPRPLMLARVESRVAKLLRTLLWSVP